MNINGIKNFTPNNYNTVKCLKGGVQNHNPNYRYNLSKDTVSFTSKQREKQPQSNIDQAAKTGAHLYKQFLSNPDFDLKEYFNEITNGQLKIGTIQKYRKTAEQGEKYGAHFDANILPDNSIIDAIIYLPEINTQDEHIALQGAMNTAHEFTHYLQAQNGEFKKLRQSFASQRPEYFSLISRMGTEMFRKFENEILASTIIGFFQNPQDIASNYQYGFFVPRRATVTLQEFFKKSGYRTEGNFEYNMNNAFLNEFNACTKDILASNDMVKSVLKTLLKTFAQEVGSENIFQDLRKYFEYKAQTEFEAYTAESNVAKKVLKITKPLNIDANQMYYSQLKKVFSKPIKI